MLAIIPARGASKGIPRKNLVALCGHPLIEYTVREAQKSKKISQILISTEDEEIASACESFGLKVSYRRPMQLANDHTSMEEVLRHCLTWALSENGSLREFMLLQPTSPLRLSIDIDNAIEKYNLAKVRSLVSINLMKEHPYECLEIKKDLKWSFLKENILNKQRRQDYENNYYYINGAIYIGNVAFFLSTGQIIDKKSVCFYDMPPERSVDIDEFMDLGIAEVLLNNQKQRRFTE